ncbi:GNAT family N-acetyltransferase, partial [Candidatus Aminicenantes bacterium AC-335-A11]|nr:GNAT family N-acetyltransferase [Candidatus Aminicenantes bacterium AC-335-A11]
EEIFFESIFDYLKKYSNIKLIYIREDSPTLKHLPEIASKYNFECKINVIEKSLYISPPLSYDDYLIGLNSKNRHELKRKLRKTQMLENLRIEKITSLNDLKHFINFFIDFHKKSSLQKYKFWKSNTYCFFNEICKEFALNNWIELYFLFHKDRIISALFCFSYSKKLYLYNSAFDKNYSQYNPGLYLFNHVIKEAIQKSIEEIDFLRGEERYKYDFGAKARKLYEVLIQRSKE